MQVLLVVLMFSSGQLPLEPLEDQNPGSIIFKMNDQKAQNIAKQAAELSFGWGGHSMEVEMTVFTKDGEKTLTFTYKALEVESYGNMARAFVNSPPFLAGSFFIAHAPTNTTNSMWLFNTTDGSIKEFFYAAQYQPFFDSHLACEDLVPHTPGEYEYSLVNHRTYEQDVLCAVVSRKPRYASSAYSSQSLWIGLDDNLVRRIDCFDQEFYDWSEDFDPESPGVSVKRGGNLVKTIEFFDYQQFNTPKGKFWQPGKIVFKTIKDGKLTGEKTQLVCTNHQFPETLTTTDFYPEF